jgi:hypothetical protein
MPTRAPARTSSLPTRDATSPNRRRRPTGPTPAYADPANARTPSSKRGKSSTNCAAAPSGPAALPKPSTLFNSTNPPHAEKGSMSTHRSRSQTELSSALHVLEFTGRSRDLAVGGEGHLGQNIDFRRDVVLLQIRGGRFREERDACDAGNDKRGYGSQDPAVDLSLRWLGIEFDAERGPTGAVATCGGPFSSSTGVAAGTKRMGSAMSWPRGRQGAVEGGGPCWASQELRTPFAGSFRPPVRNRERAGDRSRYARAPSSEASNGACPSERNFNTSASVGWSEPRVEEAATRASCRAGSTARVSEVWSSHFGQGTMIGGFGGGR